MPIESCAKIAQKARMYNREEEGNRHGGQEDPRKRGIRRTKTATDGGEGILQKPVAFATQPFRIRGGKGPYGSYGSYGIYGSYRAYRTYRTYGNYNDL